MKLVNSGDKALLRELNQIGELRIPPKFILLTKVDCYQLHRYISTDFDCICEDLTWNNDLVFNTETFTHKDMYENLFKLKFKGIQLGQE